MELGTSLGLGLASGLNAYLPLLSFAIAARWLHWYRVNPAFSFLTSNWCIIALIVLTLADFVADKVLIIDHTWDAVHSVIRPLAGALVAAASSNTITIPVHLASISSSGLSAVTGLVSSMHVVGVGLLIIALLGGILAAMSHASKAAIRLTSTLTTAGLLNAFLSLGEDILVVVAILLSLLIPVIMLVAVILFLLILGRPIFFLWSLRLRRSRFFL